jgi:rhodanese-related sulfurtransferase
MNPIFVVALVAVAIVFFMAFKGIRQTGTFINADARLFAEKIKLGGNIVIVDVRTPSEVAQGAIKDSINVDVSAPDFKGKIAGLDKEKTYMVYCRSGVRSVRACNIMSENGFKNLVNLQGGYQAWTSYSK